MILKTLETLYVLSAPEQTCPHRNAMSAHRIARHLGSSVEEVKEALMHLESRGLADASKCRLTLRGLAASAALYQPIAEQQAA